MRHAHFPFFYWSLLLILFTYREPRGLEVRGGSAVAPRTLTSVVHATSAFSFLLLKLASNPFYLPRASWARGKRRNRCRPKDAIERRSCDKRIPTKSGIRESNPPPRLGKPMHYRCANAAISLQNYYFFFIYAKKTIKYLFFPQRTCIYFVVLFTRASAFVYIGVRDWPKTRIFAI